MQSFDDFLAWAVTQSNAATKAGLSESMVSLIRSGKRDLLPEHVIRIEQNTDGLFRADQLMPGVEFERDEAGRITGYRTFTAVEDRAA